MQLFSSSFARVIEQLVRHLAKIIALKNLNIALAFNKTEIDFIRLIDKFLYNSCLIHRNPSRNLPQIYLELRIQHNQ